MNGGGATTTTRRPRQKTTETTSTVRTTNPIIPSKVPYTILTDFSSSSLPSSYAYAEETVTSPSPTTPKTTTTSTTPSTTRSSSSTQRTPTIVTLSSVPDEEKFLQEVVSQVNVFLSLFLSVTH